MSENVFDGKYQIVSELGSGGMSTVYRCVDLGLRREVALKVMAAHRLLDKAAMARFQREGKAIASLNHENIVKVHGLFFAQNEQPYLTMEIVDGRSLSDLLHLSGPLDYSLTVQIGQQIAAALAYVHSQKIIHRDLKPANVMVNDRNHVTLLDFGVAKIFEDQSFKATRTGESVGTPLYMSPEQSVGKNIDARTDQYSLGCVLFEMLTGRPPYTGENSVTLSLSHAQEPIPSVNKYSSRKIPAAMEILITKLLSKDPDHRFFDMVEVRETLREMAKKPLAQTQNSKKVLQITAAVAALAIAGAAALFALKFHQTPQNLSAPLNTQNVESQVTQQNSSRFTNQDQKLADYLNQHPDTTVLSRTLMQGVSDDGLILLRNHPALRIVDFSRNETITDNCAKYLQGLHLERLTLAHTLVGDALIKVFPTMQYLQNVDLTDSNITSSSCKYIAGCPNMIILDLANNESIDDEGLKSLSPLTKLGNLNISFTSVKDLAHSLTNDNLNTLSLDGLKLRKVDFVRISKLQKLSHLLISQASFEVDDVMILKSPPLTRLVCVNSQLSPESVQKLKQHFPDVFLEVSAADSLKFKNRK